MPHIIRHTPKLLDGLNYESKGEDSEKKKRNWGAFPSSQHFGVEGHVGASRWN